jgi:hypothetical protein
MGVIEKVPAEELERKCSYLPHRPVFKPSSSTTPIRPVFDASVKAKGMPSLNECLEKGPNLIEEVPDILTRFRKKKYGVVSDIKKAFLQISLKKEDRDYLRFLWWEGLEKVTIAYRHCRVVFGVSSSPFLLAATIKFHLKRVDEKYKNAAELLMKSLYVDNCIACMDTEDELMKFIQDTTHIMEQGKFELCGWKWTNSGGDYIVPVLGLKWNTQTDGLSLDLRGLEEEGKSTMTKRCILSAAHKIFDPIGFSCPVTLIPKMLLQELWCLKKGWDESVPEEVAKRFLKWKQQLMDLEQIEIPRWMCPSGSSDCNRSLHVFSDASKNAYAACVFIRTEEKARVTVQLVMARSRVAPTKRMTIPRLELLGCCVGARLGESVKKMMNERDISINYWTDSSNALYWIRKNENWATFVFNRVKEIRALSTPEQWMHIPGEDNPADLPSRGCYARQLVASKWWEGPSWLKQEESEWPRSEVTVDLEVIMSEKKKTVAVHLSEKLSPPWYDKYSSYRKIIRILAWIRRWQNKKVNTVQKAGELEPEEEWEAEVVLLRIIQEEVFSIDNPLIKQMKAFRDEKGLWRIQTRILLRKDTQDFRLPILLPGDHPVVLRLITQEHLQRSHCGLQSLMSSLREKFWILKSRRAVRKSINSCGSCKRYDAKNVTPIEATLPIDRVRDAKVFEIVGIDLGGPLYLKSKQKAWFVLFTCAVYRAIHLELVTSLSTESFLQSLRRFVVRRGRSNVIYTDNGTNFEGAENALKKLDWKKISAATGVHKIEWRFNPPIAPWWGGWWERIVGLLKKLLRRVLGKANLDFEELCTVLCDCEDVLNSRPLTYLSENPDDLCPITPNMFLREVETSGIPDMDLLESAGFNKRFVYRQQLRDDIRKRFRSEYLGQLAHHKNKKKSSSVLRVGEVVLVGDDNKKRINWTLGRILELYPGRDGIIRVAKVKIASGVINRPAQRLYPLEVQKVAEADSSQAKDSEAELSGSTDGEQVIITRSGRKSRAPNRLSYS